MTRTARLLRMGCMVALPQGAAVEGGLITLDGQQYAVGPALYRLQPVEHSTPSMLGPELDRAAVNYDPQYLSEQHWPAGFVLDSAVACDFSEEIDLETRDE